MLALSPSGNREQGKIHSPFWIVSPALLNHHLMFEIQHCRLVRKRYISSASKYSFKIIVLTKQSNKKGCIGPLIKLRCWDLTSLCMQYEKLNRVLRYSEGEGVTLVHADNFVNANVARWITINGPMSHDYNL